MTHQDGNLRRWRVLAWTVGVLAGCAALGGCSLSEGAASDLVDGRPRAQRTDGTWAGDPTYRWLASDR